MKFLRWLQNNNPALSWQHLTTSVAVGFGIGFFSYILGLQTATFSRRYLLLAVLIAMAASLAAYFLLKWHPFASKNNYFIDRKSFLLVGLLFCFALPSYLFLPPYPELPFFQRKSTLVISIRTDAEPVAWSQFRRIFINTHVGKWGFRSFETSGPWVSQGDDLILPPESTGQIIWQGRVGQRASFALPIPSKQLKITTNWDHEVRQVSVEKSPYVQNKNFIPPLWYAGLIYAVAWIPLFFVFIMMAGFPRARQVLLPALLLLLAVVQANLQFQMLGEEFYTTTGTAIETVQLPRHLAVLQGSAPNPWQYRVFSEWVVAAFLDFSSKFLRPENAVFLTLLSLRILQNVAILTLAYLYYIRLDITNTTAMYGVLLLAGGMLHVFYQSDLSFNTYFDVIFFLLGAILILDEKYAWIPVLMVVASLNRETSVMIPVLLIAWGWRKNSSTRNKALLYGLASLLVWVVVFVALRRYYPDAPMFKIGDEILPGWELFRYNLTVPKMPILLLQTFGFLPLVMVLSYRYWHPFVRICVLLLVPAWLLVHAFSSVWAETRLFLVLLALAFIPSFLPFIDRQLQEIRHKTSGQLSQNKQTLLGSQR